MTNYNPADYATIKAEAKSLEKKDLEEFYVKTKDSKYTKPLEEFAIVLMVLLAISAVVLIGYSFGASFVEENIEKNVETIEEQVCPFFSGYEATVLDQSMATDEVRIDCTD